VKFLSALVTVMESSEIRVQKLIADAGICSRRAADALISQGEVWINGKIAVLGQKVDPEVDKITVSGKPLRKLSQPKITLVVNKPRGLICSNNDPYNPDTVFSILPKELRKFRFFCAGRLDKDSEGLLVLTTDGELANRLMHPSNHVVKRYHVSLSEPYPVQHLPKLIRGVVVEGERLKVERATLIGAGASKASTELDVHMHHGKKREIRQLFTVYRYEVKRLRRYQIGAIRLQGIPLRGGKQLSTKEIEALFKSPRTPRGEHTVSSDTHT